VEDSEAARERQERLEARNARRRAKGKPTWDFEEFPPGYGRGAAIASPQMADPDQPTMVVTQAQLRRAEAEEPERRRLAVSSAIFGISTGLSRVLGLVREVIASY